RRTDASPALVRLDEQILQVQAGGGPEGRVVVEEECEADGAPVALAEEYLGVGPRSEEMLMEGLPGPGHLRAQMLVGRERADQPEDVVEMGRRGRPHAQRRHIHPPSPLETNERLFV